MVRDIPEGCILLPSEKHNDQRGNLSVLTNSIPESFNLKRVYYVDGLKKGQNRGSHAHMLQSQVIFVLKGRISIKLDDGKKAYSIGMSEDSDGIFIPNLIWCSIEPVSEDAMYIVMANGPYDKDEYIYELDEFKILTGRS